MEIKRKLELQIVTDRRFVIRQSSPGEPKFCKECNESMLTAEQSAKFFNISQRRIFQFIETDLVHCFETDANEVMICVRSLSEIINGE